MKDATQSSCQVNGSLLLQECLLSQTEQDHFCRWSEASFKLELSLTFEIFNCQHVRNSWLSLHFLLDRGSEINFKYMPWISCLLKSEQLQTCLLSHYSCIPKFRDLHCTFVQRNPPNCKTDLANRPPKFYRIRLLILTVHWINLTAAASDTHKIQS